MSKALVTGGAGFIGSNIVQLLVERSYQVVVLDNFTSGDRKNLGPFPHVELIEADVRDESALKHALESVDVIFHLAASVGNVRSIEQPVEDSDVNVIGTIRLLEAARKAGVQKIVCSASAAIFGELRHLPIDEGHPTEPDVARANLLAAELRNVSGAFNIASGASTTINQLARMIHELSGIETQITHVPPRKEEVRDSRADMSAAARTLGYEPTVRIDEGLSEYLAWARSEWSAEGKLVASRA